MSIRVEGVSKSFSAYPALDRVSLTIKDGEFVALLGPSGSGKTTLLRILAGLERPDAGTVTIGDRVVAGPGGQWVAPEKRRVGLVFQDWALFPHLSVDGNVGYGVPRSDRRRRVDEALALVGLSGLGDRMPATLSGGQQQRVALARALAPRPSVLLLDEPFSNLDTALRVQVRSEVHALLTALDVTAIFVTHDQDEAFVLGDHVAVMSEGCIVQSAAPRALYERPVTPWVASFVGDANLLPGLAAGPTASTPIGDVPLADANLSGPVQVLVRPESLRVSAGDAGTVEVAEYYGRESLLVLGVGTTTLRARSSESHDRGARVSVTYAGGPAVAWPAPG
jgi:iron(III) transport system ATP-binding protein